MISINVYQDSYGNFMKFDTKGHADFAEEGQDIVCAAVSVLVINTINSIMEFTSCKCFLDQNQEEGEIHFELFDSMDDSKLLMDSLVLGLNSIQENYGSDFIQLNYKEV